MDPTFTARTDLTSVYVQSSVLLAMVISQSVPVSWTVSVSESPALVGYVVVFHSSPAPGSHHDQQLLSLFPEDPVL